jgi:hypothetical protein
MSPPHRQSVAQFSAELGIHVVTLYNWRKAWRLQGEVVPASEKDLEGWGANDPKVNDVSGQDCPIKGTHLTRPWAGAHSAAAHRTALLTNRVRHNS